MKLGGLLGFWCAGGDGNLSQAAMKFVMVGSLCSTELLCKLEDKVILKCFMQLLWNMYVMKKRCLLKCKLNYDVWNSCCQAAGRG